jgi:hypothetical protein
MQERSPWKLILVVSVLLFVVAIGIAHVVKPDWFIRRSGVRKGGEMLSEGNRFQFQIVGAIFAAAAGYGLYTLLAAYLSH